MADFYGDGLVTVCDLTNTSADGDMPVYSLESICTQYFEERVISLTRSYLARGVDERVDMVIRIAAEECRPRIGQIAVLTYYEGQDNPDGDQFRIDMVQAIKNDDGLRAYDLTLYRLEENYDCTF